MLKLTQNIKIKEISEKQINNPYKVDPKSIRPDVVDAKVYKLKSAFIKNSVFVKDFHLQLRSNEVIVDIHEETEALYFVRSVMGVLNGPTTEYFTIGQLRNGKMYKEMWLVPELIMDRETVETIDECFEEAILYNEQKKTNRQKQVQT